MSNQTYTERLEQTYALGDEIDYNLDALEPRLVEIMDARRDLIERADCISRRLVALDLEATGLSDEVTALKTAGSLLAGGETPARVRALLEGMRAHRPREDNRW